jgi:isopenicillin-N epimerase
MTGFTDFSDDFLLRPDIVPLNNGSFGVCPKPVFDEYQRWQREFERHPDGYVRRWSAEMDHARAALADYLHTSNDQLGFVFNATFGVNVIVNSLRAMLREGDQVLTTDHEYNACNMAWQFTSLKTGARYIKHSMPVPVTTPAAWIEEFWKGVNPRTRVIYLSHITSPTALTFPIKEICQRARDAGIISVIDGAHVPGQRELDLEDIGADFYTGNCHKWLCAPKGSAFVYARKDIQHLIEPLVVGHGWRPDVQSANPLVDYVEFLGTRDLAPFLAVPAAIEFVRAHNWPAVRARCHALATETRRRIEDMLDTESICPDGDAWYNQMVSVRLPDRMNVTKLGAALREQHGIEVPVFNWNGVNILRISVQAYTVPAHLDTLFNAVKQHAPECMG